MSPVAGVIASRGRPGRAGQPALSSDAGFSLLEAVVSTALVAVMIAALCTFLLTTTSVTHRQGGQQAAVHLAADGVELVRAVSGPELPAGLPSSPETKTVNGVAYQRAWSVVTCWQQLAGPPEPPGAPPSCEAQSTSPGTGYVKVFKVTVTVTWPDRGCPDPACSYSTATLVDAVSTQPQFNTNS